MIVRVAAVLLTLAATEVSASHRWTMLGAAPDEQSRIGVGAVATDPFAASTIYASTDSARALAKSIDGGRTWVVLPLRLTLIRKIIVEPSQPNAVTVLSWNSGAGSEPNQVARSTDGGATWVVNRVEVPTIGLLWDLVVDPRDTRVLYGCTTRACLSPSSCVKGSGGVAKSTDGGRRWTALFKDISVAGLRFDPLTRMLYTTEWGAPGSRRSEDGGASWSMLSPPGGSTIWDLALDPIVPGVLYVSAPNGLWRSDDRGEHWLALQAPSRYTGNARLAISPTQRSVLVATGWYQDHVSTDGGMTWTAIEPLPMIDAPQQSVTITGFAFATDGTLYAASSNGVLRLDPFEPGPRRRASRH